MYEEIVQIMVCNLLESEEEKEVEKKRSKDKSKYNAVVSLYKSGTTWSEIQKITVENRSTISRWLNEAELVKNNSVNFKISLLSCFLEQNHSLVIDLLIIRPLYFT